MTDEFKSELRKAFANTTLLVVGAFAGAGLGYLSMGDHWVATWVFPVVGAWLVYHAVRSFRTAPSQDS
jgi:putative Mn2+ efflux pump MntP